MESVKKIFKNYSSIIFYFLSILFSVIIAFKCFSLHYAPDTYRALNTGLEIYGKYAILALGRFFMWIYFRLISSFSYNTICIFKTALSIFIISFAVRGVYNKFIKYFNNSDKNKIIIFLFSFCSIVNLFSVEFFYYIESPIMWLSVLSCVYAAIIFSSNVKFKYVISTALLLFTVFSYQPNINLFFCLILFIQLMEKNKAKKTINNIVRGTCEYGFAALLNLLFIFFILKPAYNVSTYKYSSNFTIDGFIKILKYMLKQLFINSYPKYIYTIIYVVIILLLSLVLYLKKKSLKPILNYVFIIILIIFISLLPTLSLDANNLYFGKRFFVSIYMSYFLSFIFIYSYLCNNIRIKNVFLLVSCVLFCFNTIFCYNIISNQVKINNMEKEQINTINTKLDSRKNYTDIPPNNIYIITTHNNGIDKYNINNKTLKINYRRVLFKNLIEDKVFIEDALNYYSNIKRDYPNIIYSYNYGLKCNNLYEHDIFIYDNDLYFCFDY